MNETRQILIHIETCLENKKVKLNNLKHNISNEYFLAKQDFRIIENYEEEIETYTYIIDKLNELNDRIIERNEVSII